MAAGEPTDAHRPLPSVFLSYASEDRQAAQVIRDALPGLGLDVWYDESELGGGEAWDQKIRRQIRECDFFMPVVSAHTEARHEGYFRREWRLAVERTLDMADDHIFLLPVVIDGTVDSIARVPEKFLAVQWMRLPGGKPTPAFEAMCRRLASGQTSEAGPAKKPAADVSGSSARPWSGKAAKIDNKSPEFPQQEPGKNAQFYAQVGVWAVQSAWMGFRRFPKWLRIIAYAWLGVVVLSKGCNSSSDHPRRGANTDARKLKQISDQYLHGTDKPDLAGLAAQIAREFPDEASSEAHEDESGGVSAIPFSAPSDDQQATRVADAVFAQVYGSVAIGQHGRVHMSTAPLPDYGPSAAAERGKADNSTYVVYGWVDKKVLTIKLVTVTEVSVLWSQDYPLEGVDAVRIAADVVSKLPKAERE